MLGFQIIALRFENAKQKLLAIKVIQVSFANKRRKAHRMAKIIMKIALKVKTNNGIPINYHNHKATNYI